MAALEVLLPPPWDTPLLLAVSGGADSMALLHVLHRGGCPVAVAHFDHQTRSGASTEEGDFVAEQTEALGVPVHRGGADVTALAAAASESFEMVARRARYAFFAKTAREYGYCAIATGHHADDQTETVLLRLIRGTSPTGLGGIHPHRRIHGLPLVRPLLSFHRPMLEAWLHREEILWREDASNADTEILRNKIRHELLPLLKGDYNPRAGEALNRLAEIQRREDGLLARLSRELLDQCCEGEGRIHRQTFSAIDEALQFRVMAELIRRGGGTPSYETVCRAIEHMAQGETGKQIDVGKGITLFCGEGHAVIAAAHANSVAQPLAIPGETQVGTFQFQCTRLDGHPNEPLAQYCTPARQLFDGACLGNELSIRTRKSGDRFQPMGMTGTKKLKDYFNDLGLTRAERDRQLLVTSDDNILWVVGHGICGDAALSPETTSLVEITVSEVE